MADDDDDVVALAYLYTVHMSETNKRKQRKKHRFMYVKFIAKHVSHIFETQCI